MKKFILSAAALLFAGAVMAGPVNGQLTIVGYEHGLAPTGTMTLNPPGPSNTRTVTAGVSALKMDFVPTGGDPLFDSESFLAYCIELFAPTANFGVAVNYTQNTAPALGALNNPLTSLQESRLTKLFVKNGTPDGSTANAASSAAMQLAIWEIIYDETNFGDLSAGVFGLGAGQFYSTPVDGARAAAENLIAGLDSYNTNGFTGTFTSFNNGGAKSGKQDFLSFSLNSGGGCEDFGGGACEIPEPGSFALAGLGLLGLGLVRRRKAT